MTDRVIGRCSKCGGPVTVPQFFYSTVPPSPTCRVCGAVKQNNLPVIEMDDDSDGPIGERILLD